MQESKIIETRHSRDYQYIRKLKNKTGVYLLFEGEEVIYVGQTINLYTRIVGHNKKSYTHVNWVELDERYLWEYEDRYIKYFNPRLNKNPASHITRREPSTMTNNIQKLIDKKKVTKEELAVVTGVTFGTIVNWCNNKTQPKLHQAILIVKQLDVTNKELFNYDN